MPRSRRSSPSCVSASSTPTPTSCASRAKRNGQTLLTQAQAAQERAAAIYADLVARGEVVVGRSMPAPRDESPIHADVIEPAKVETLEAEAPKAEFVKKPAARARKNDTTKNDTTKGDAK